MERKTTIALSKFLSFVLRHQPQSIGITLDENGWVGVENLLAHCRANGRLISFETLKQIVATSPKNRFALSEDETRIRANQGHSIEVDLGYESREPPAVLFHGTVGTVLEEIRAMGLLKMGRHHVHLSSDLNTAAAVGSRRGRPIVLQIAAAQMHADGHAFYLSANGVWLTEHVPPQYIAFP
jgi:putative RNA 2'-phosphotransferase